MSRGNFISTRQSLKAALEIPVSFPPDKKGAPLKDWMPKLATMDSITHAGTENELKLDSKLSTCA